MSTASEAQSEQHGHQHRDVSGGWLRPAVFGAMDGLVTNVSLISGVGGGGGSQHFIVLTGLAGLAAGAFSMATGEFVSVSSQNELIGAEVRKEAHELKHNPESERQELAETFQARGVDPELAQEVARQLSVRPDNALAVHVREELGVDPAELPSPYTAAAASLITFSAGAIIPLIPYLAGVSPAGLALGVALGLAALAAFIGGGLVARLTDRPFLRGALRQLVLGGLAAGITYLIGMAVGTHV